MSCKEVTKLTRLLRCAMKLIEGEYGPHYVDGIDDDGNARELKTWWEEHKDTKGK